MRFEIPKPGSDTLSDLRLHENPNTKVDFNKAPTTGDTTNNIGNCGSEADGLANLNNTKRPPCMIMVDVKIRRELQFLIRFYFLTLIFATYKIIK